MDYKKRIVLLHGWGASTIKLKPLAEELRKLEWEVFTPKLPGFDSPPPEKIWGVGEYSKYVLKETRKIYGRDRFFVFGHSFGGRVAIKLAEKNNRQILGAVLCSSSGLSRGNLVKRTIFWLLARVGKVFLAIPPLANFWKRLLYKLAREHDYEKAQGIMKEVFKKVVSEDLKPVAKEIKIPTLVLWGKKDKMTPISDAYYIKKVLPNAKLVVFKDEGHRLPYNKPKGVAEEIDKWTKNLN